MRKEIGQWYGKNNKQKVYANDHDRTIRWENYASCVLWTTEVIVYIIMDDTMSMDSNLTANRKSLIELLFIYIPSRLVFYMTICFIQKINKKQKRGNY